MKFSIAMATYNGGDYVLEQLQSFEAQDYMPYELVICDDGSTDETINIIKNFSKDALFKVKLYQNEKNLGYAQNFAKAIKLCEGDWIALSDHDDKWFVNKLSTIKSEIEKNVKTKIIIHDYILTNSNLIEKPTTKMGRLKASGGKPEDMISGCATVFHESCRDYILPIPNTGIAHDSWIHNIFIYKYSERAVLNQPLMYYRRHNSNASSSFESTDKLKSKLRKLLHYRVGNALPGYLLRKEHLQTVSERLKYHHLNTYDQEKLEKEIQSITDRVEILESSFPNRQKLAIRYFIQNGYRQFNGIISFINDITKLTKNSKTHNEK